MASLIELKNISKIYQDDDVATTALNNINLTVNQGEFMAIMGASGSGKSTLLHIIGLLDRPTRGTYFLDKQDTSQFNDAQQAYLRNNKIGFVFQAFYLLSRTSVLQNTMLPLQYSNIPRQKHLPLAKKALSQVNMLHRLDHHPNQLSGGEKQRACIARALVTQPQILLADEPTGNLDSKAGASIMELIDQLHQQGLTIIVITHETPTARYANRIITLQDGKIITDRQRSPRRHPYYTK